MKRSLRVSTTVGLLLAGSSTFAQSQSTDQNQDDRWDGPGFYLEQSFTGGRVIEVYKLGGPYSSLDACRRTPGVELGQKPFGEGETETTSCVYRESSVKYAQDPYDSPD